MLRIGYIDNKRLNIKDYDDKLHKNKVVCAQNHILIAKRGNVRKHHFCHRNKEGDTSCSTGTGTWHLWHQNRINETNIELRFQKDILKIADGVNIIDNKLHIIEFQKSKMDRKEMRLREKFYTRRDLFSDYNVPDCTSILIWVFCLVHCDIEIDHIFGDVICFRWIKGSKFMLNSKCDGLVKTYYDLGKRDLLQIYCLHKPKIIETKFIARLVHLSEFDKMYYPGILKELDDSQKRLDVHKIANYKTLSGTNSENIRLRVVDLCRKMYFEGDFEILPDDISKVISESKET